MKKSNSRLAVCLLLSLFGYLYFGFGLHRENFLQLASVYVVLFAFYVLQVKKIEAGNEKILFAAAIVFRLSFLFSIPALSDDYFRFVWDGKMTAMGLNPYSVIPSLFPITQSGVQAVYLQNLEAGMNSADYFTLYPPVLEFIFAVAGFLFPENIVGAIAVLRIFCIAAETGTIFLIIRLLRRFQLPGENVWWYALNPLVIIELTGNLHFEAIMIFFLLLSVYYLFPGENKSSFAGTKTSLRNSVLGGLAYALAISSKLIPLLFLPFLIKRLKWKNGFLIFITIFITCTLLFLPFISHGLVQNITSSLSLYFQKFEFNAGIYYIIRWIGFQTSGYNVINQVGPVLGVLVFILVMWLMISEKKITPQNFFMMMQWTLTIYLLLATNVHPWYVVPLVMMSVFTGFRYGVVWSLFIIFSYATYQTKPYHENLWLTLVEYSTVFTALLIELMRYRKSNIMKSEI